MKTKREDFTKMLNTHFTITYINLNILNLRHGISITKVQNTSYCVNMQILYRNTKHI